MEIGIDFETRSFQNLRVVGARKYAEDQTTDIICLSWAIDNQPPQLWTPLFQQPPLELLNIIHQHSNSSALTIHAWNAEFEMAIWEEVAMKKYGWPAVQFEQWRDTMAQAGLMSLPLGMDKTADILNTRVKSADGKALIKKLSMPYKGKFREYADYPDDFQKMYDYCKNDVVVEREIRLELPALPPKELLIWRHCVDMNNVGIPFRDYEVHAVQEKVATAKDRVNAQITVLTKGDILKVTQNKKILAWINERLSFAADSLNATSVDSLLAMDDKVVPRLVKRILKLRKKGGKSSTAKLTKISDRLCADGTVKNNLIYYGANTGRYAGRGIQPQNFVRANVDDPDTVLSNYIIMDAEFLELFYDIIGQASKLLRSLIVAPKGMKFVVADFSQIEAIVTPWMAGESEIMDAIRSGSDLYKATASLMFKMEYAFITAVERQAGKVCVLACGFAGGKGALIGMAQNYDMVLNETQAQSYVDKFRQGRPKLVKCWYAFEKAAKSALDFPEDVHLVEGIPIPIRFYKSGPNLRMKLPSGRDINYPNARIEWVQTPWGQNKLSVVYDTQVGDSRKWDTRSMTGGNLFQNAVQGTARDLLCDAQLNVERKGYKIFLSVHDECGALVPDTPQYNLPEFIDIMTRKPAWATDMVVKADGYEAYRYKK